MSGQGATWQWLVSGQRRAAPRRGLWLVAGGSSRVGVSATTALLARAAAASGRAVLLVDATGGQSRQADSEPAAQCPTLVSVVRSPSREGAPEGLTAAGLRHVRAQMPRYDLILVDAGSRLATVREVWSALSTRDGASERLLVVASPRAPLAACFALAKVFGARRANTGVDMLVSGANANEALAAFTQMQAAADRFLGQKVGFIGALPDEPTLRGGAGQASLRTAPMNSLRSDAVASELLLRMLALAHQNVMAPTVRHSNLETYP